MLRNASRPLTPVKAGVDVTFWKKSARLPPSAAFLPNSASTRGLPSCAATSAWTLIHRRAKRSLCSSSALQHYMGAREVLVDCAVRSVTISWQLFLATIHWAVISVSAERISWQTEGTDQQMTSTLQARCSGRSFRSTWASTCRARGACRRSRDGGSQNSAQNRSPG